MCGRMNIHVWEVIDAATNPFGFMPFYPGSGLGGHGIPIDPFYLFWKSKEAILRRDSLSWQDTVNGRMFELVVEKLQNALNRASISVRGSHVYPRRQLQAQYAVVENSELIVDTRKALKDPGGRT